MSDEERSLGFMKHCPVWTFASEASFGSPGAGGSLGFSDPKAGIGYGYVTSGMGTALTGDPRDIALRHALYSVISAGATAQRRTAFPFHFRGSRKWLTHEP